LDCSVHAQSRPHLEVNLSVNGGSWQSIGFDDSWKLPFFSSYSPCSRPRSSSQRHVSTVSLNARLVALAHSRKATAVGTGLSSLQGCPLRKNAQTTVSAPATVEKLEMCLFQRTLNPHRSHADRRFRALLSPRRMSSCYGKRFRCSSTNGRARRGFS
jgi:hypothetical protein